MQPSTELTPRSPRVRFPRDVRVVPIGGPPRAYRLRATNLSKEGVFLTMTRPLEEGTRVALSLEASGLVLPFAQGEVVRRQDPMMAVAAQENGVAVRFTDFLHPRAGEMVSYLVETLQTGQPLQPAKPTPKWKRRLGAVAGVGALSVLTAAMVLGAAVFWKDSRKGKGAEVAEEERAPVKIAAVADAAPSASKEARAPAPAVTEAQATLAPVKEVAAEEPTEAPRGREDVLAAPEPPHSAEAATAVATRDQDAVARPAEDTVDRAAGETSSRPQAPAEQAAVAGDVKDVDAPPASTAKPVADDATPPEPEPSKAKSLTQTVADETREAALALSASAAKKTAANLAEADQTRDVVASAAKKGTAKPADTDETRDVVASAARKTAAKPADTDETRDVVASAARKTAAKPAEPDQTRDLVASAAKKPTARPAEAASKPAITARTLALPSGAVTQLSWTSGKDQLRVEPRLAAGSSVEKVFLLSHPARLVFDVAGGAPKKSVTLKVGAGSMDRVRVGKQGSSTRIVIDLDQAPATLTQKDGAAVLKF